MSLPSPTGQTEAVGLPNGAFEMEAAKVYFIIFGLLTIAGGIIGYVKAGSTASIIAGGITGVLLIVAALLLPQHRVAGLATALIISVLLAGQFVPKFFRTGRIMPNALRRRRRGANDPSTSWTCVRRPVLTAFCETP